MKNLTVLDKTTDDICAKLREEFERKGVPVNVWHIQDAIYVEIQDAIYGDILSDVPKEGKTE